MSALLYGQAMPQPAVTLVGRAKVGVDSDNNDVYEPTERVAEAAITYPASSDESFANRDLLTTDVVLLLPASESLRFVDAVRVGGLTYEVQGEPERFVSPLSGEQAMRALLRRASG